MIAHIGGVPVEEFLLPFVSWGGAGVLVARAWVARVGRGKARTATTTTTRTDERIDR